MNFDDNSQDNKQKNTVDKERCYKCGESYFDENDAYCRFCGTVRSIPGSKPTNIDDNNPDINADKLVVGDRLCGECEAAYIDLKGQVLQSLWYISRYKKISSTQECDELSVWTAVLKNI